MGGGSDSTKKSSGASVKKATPSERLKAKKKMKEKLGTDSPKTKSSTAKTAKTTKTVPRRPKRPASKVKKE